MPGRQKILNPYTLRPASRYDDIERLDDSKRLDDDRAPGAGGRPDEPPVVAARDRQQADLE